MEKSDLHVYRCKRLKRKLQKLKERFLWAIKENKVEAFDDVLKEAGNPPFIIFEHTICKEKRARLCEELEIINGLKAIVDKVNIFL